MATGTAIGSNIDVKLDGLHHVTAITADIEANLEFYGLSLIHI